MARWFDIVPWDPEAAEVEGCGQSYDDFRAGFSYGDAYHHIAWDPTRKGVSDKAVKRELAAAKRRAFREHQEQCAEYARAKAAGELGDDDTDPDDFRDEDWAPAVQSRDQTEELIPLAPVFVWEPQAHRPRDCGKHDTVRGQAMCEAYSDETRDALSRAAKEPNTMAKKKTKKKKSTVSKATRAKLSKAAKKRKRKADGAFK